MVKKGYTEFQGVDKVWIAEVTEDSDANYTCGTPEHLIPAGELSTTSNTDKATKYYDNIPFLVVASEGSTDLTLTCPVLPLEMQSKITGKYYDEATGALMDSGQPIVKYFALMYRERFLDGTYRYVVRHKTSISLNDQSNKSLDESTDSNGMELAISSITTQHVFTKTGTVSKAMIVDERDGKAEVSKWYTAVETPDTLKPKSPSM